MSSSYKQKSKIPRDHHSAHTYGGTSSPANRGVFGSEFRRRSAASSISNGKRGLQRNKSFNDGEDWDVNNPPSVPNSPRLGSDLGYDDVMLAGDEAGRGRSPERRNGGDALIDIDEDEQSSSPKSPDMLKRRSTVAARAEEDVCFPHENMSEIAEEDEQADKESTRARRRRRRRWPDLRVLEDWAVEEKEERTMEGIRARKVAEPLMIGGRLRPKQVAWHHDQDDALYRFSYFNEEFQNTIHSQTISELLQEKQTFRDLFIPEPPLIEESSSSSESEDDRPQPNGSAERPHIPSSIRSPTPSETPTRVSRAASQAGVEPLQPQDDSKQGSSNFSTGQSTPQPAAASREKQRRYGPRPVFWLDVMNPTDSEMKVLSKAFGIHPLTAEDIMLQEAREKVELFRHYYFVAYRSFEQDVNNEDYLEPVNMYVVVFKDGVITVSQEYFFYPRQSLKCQY